jgi:hypothetical protein
MSAKDASITKLPVSDVPRTEGQLGIGKARIPLARDRVGRNNGANDLAFYVEALDQGTRIGAAGSHERFTPRQNGYGLMSVVRDVEVCLTVCCVRASSRCIALKGSLLTRWVY